MSLWLGLVGVSGIALLLATVGLAVNGRLGPRGPALAVLLLATVGVSVETNVVGGGQGLSAGATVLVLFGTVIAIATHWSQLRRVEIHRATIWPFLIGTWLFVVNTIATPQTPLIDNLLRIAPVGTWLALALLVSTGLLTKEAIAAAVVAAFGWACVLSLASPTPWGPCSAFKCGPFGQLLIGPFANENFFGRLACLAGVCAFLVWRGRFRWVAPFAAFLVLFATASRTSQLALIVAAALAGAIFGRYSRTSSAGLRTSPWLAAVAVCSFALYLVYNAEPSDFSNRGGIWLMGVEVLGDSWLFGRGLSTWSTDVLERNFMHSEVLLMLYSGGIVAIVLWGALLTAAFRASAISRSSLCLSIVIVILGLTEVIWNPLAIDGTVVMLLALFVVVAQPSSKIDAQRLKPIPPAAQIVQV